MKQGLGIAVLGAALISASLVANAQQREDIGKYEYQISCAVCHGDDGKGEGSISKYYNKRAADLTVIQKNNNSVFPFDRVYEVIDGRQTVAAHGPGDMPVWGDVYSARGAAFSFGYANLKDLESYTRGRIIALIGYIYTLQGK
jgi:mono/diheme cytochrome c family protein